MATNDPGSPTYDYIESAYIEGNELKIVSRERREGDYDYPFEINYTETLPPDRTDPEVFRYFRAGGQHAEPWNDRPVTVYDNIQSEKSHGVDFYHRIKDELVGIEFVSESRTDGDQIRLLTKDGNKIDDVDSLTIFLNKFHEVYDNSVISLNRGDSLDYDVNRIRFLRTNDPSGRIYKSEWPFARIFDKTVRGPFGAYIVCLVGSSSENKSEPFKLFRDPTSKRYLLDPGTYREAYGKLSGISRAVLNKNGSVNSYFYYKPGAYMSIAGARPLPPLGQWYISWDGQNEIPLCNITSNTHDKILDDPNFSDIPQYRNDKYYGFECTGSTNTWKMIWDLLVTGNIVKIRLNNDTVSMYCIVIVDDDKIELLSFSVNGVLANNGYPPTRPKELILKMTPAQFGNPQYDKPIDGMNPGDLIGFIAEMVYGIQNNDSVNVLNAIPGIYVPGVIPEQSRYYGRNDDVIKHQFTRTLNKWIELKPKNALTRDELDAIDDLVNELIMLSGNPTTPSGLEDNSVYSLSTLFKGSLYKERPPRVSPDTEPPAAANAGGGEMTPKPRYEYSVTFVRQESDTGRAFYRVTRLSGEPMTYDRTTVKTYLPDETILTYDGHDSYYLSRDQLPPAGDVTTTFEIAETDEQNNVHRYRVDSVRVLRRPKEEYHPVYEDGHGKPEVTIETGNNNPPAKPRYEYHISRSDDGWTLSTEPGAIFTIARADGGALPDDIEVRYLENKYFISNGRFTVPNNDLPVHEKQVSLKVSYTDDPSEVGSVVNNVTLPAHYPHEFRIEKLNRDFTTGAVTYRVRLASLNRIDEDISVYHEDVEFNTSRANDGSDDVEFTIPNSLLPENDEIWEIEVRYPHFGETVISRVRGVEVEARLIESKPALFTRGDGKPNGTATIKPREDDRPSGTSSIPYRAKESSPADSTDTRVHQSPPQ